RVVKLMYFDKPLDYTPLMPGCDARIALSANGLAVLALGIFPSALLTLCLAAFP
ncbi:MAG: NADH:ubiquinone oxidoreductase subunit N, partial [Gammaproteobacteria bacterium]